MIYQYNKYSLTSIAEQGDFIYTYKILSRRRDCSLIMLDTEKVTIYVHAEVKTSAAIFHLHSIEKRRPARESIYYSLKKSTLNYHAGNERGLGV